MPRFQRGCAALLTLAALFLPKVLRAQDTTTTAQAPPPAPAVNLPASSTITLRPGDILRITIWREPDLSGEFLIDEQGIATLPLLGERQVTGIPLRQLRQQLIDAYRGELRNPSITVVPLRRVNILGEVNRPGLYGLDPTVTLAGAVATAGGAAPTGDIRRIRIIRDGQVLLRRADAGVTLSSVDIRSGDEIIVDRRGWVERNTSLVVTAILSVTSIAITLLTRPHSTTSSAQ